MSSAAVQARNAIGGFRVAYLIAVMASSFHPARRVPWCSPRLPGFLFRIVGARHTKSTWRRLLWKRKAGTRCDSFVAPLLLQLDCTRRAIGATLEKEGRSLAQRRLKSAKCKCGALGKQRAHLKAPFEWRQRDLNRCGRPRIDRLVVDDRPASVRLRGARRSGSLAEQVVQTKSPGEHSQLALPGDHHQCRRRSRRTRAPVSVDERIASGLLPRLEELGNQGTHRSDTRCKPHGRLRAEPPGFRGRS